MMSCQEVRRLTERFLAQELSRADEVSVREHLRACPDCRDLVVAREPALLLALEPEPAAEVDAEDFVAGVMGGIRERRVERSLRVRRSRWLAAAAALAVAVLGGVGGFRLLGTRPGAVAADAGATAVERFDEPPQVTVEGENVRLYQVSLAGEPGVQVAFVIDPALEL